jgi:murein DD-endopeptidase MepM/ murein hydrolase activator NlpD
MSRKNFFLFGFLAGILLAGALRLVSSQTEGPEIEPARQSNPPPIQVQVEGAVAAPGLYLMDKDSRLMDALAAAGGLLPEADWSGLNLAATLYDTQKIEIPYLSTDDGTVAERPPPEVDVAAGSRVQSPTQAAPMAADVCSEEVTGNGVFTWPTDAHFLTGNDYSYDHPGIDLAAGEGSPVHAVDSGMVRREGNDEAGYGNIIEIDHGNGYSTVYAHLSVIGVRACQSVQAGQVIGTAGSTGNASGAHLHFEVLLHGDYINPWSVLPEP